MSDPSAPPSGADKTGKLVAPGMAERVCTFLHTEEQRRYWRLKRQASRDREWEELLAETNGDPELATARRNRRRRISKRIERRFDYSPFLFVGDRGPYVRRYTRSLRLSPIAFTRERLATTGCHFGPRITSALIDHPWPEYALQSLNERRPLDSLPEAELIGHAFGLTLIFLELAALFDRQQPHHQVATRRLRRELHRSLCFLYVRPEEILWDLLAWGGLPLSEPFDLDRSDEPKPNDTASIALFCLSQRLHGQFLTTVLCRRAPQGRFARFPGSLSSLAWTTELEDLWAGHPLYPPSTGERARCGCAWTAEGYLPAPIEPGTYIVGPCIAHYRAPLKNAAPTLGAP